MDGIMSVLIERWMNGSVFARFFNMHCTCMHIGKKAKQWVKYILLTFEIPTSHDPRVVPTGNLSYHL